MREIGTGIGPTALLFTLSRLRIRSIFRSRRAQARDEAKGRVSCRISEAVLLADAAQFFPCLALLVGVKSRLSKLMVRNSEYKMIQIDADAFLRFEHFLGEILRPRRRC